MGSDTERDAARRLLEQVAMRVIDVPGVFTLMPVEKNALDPRNLWSRPARIILWCTHPGGFHPVTDASYEVVQPREWFLRALPYFKTTLRLLRFAPVIQGAVSNYDLNVIASHLQVMDAICRASEEELARTEHNSLSHVGMPHSDSFESPLDREIKKLLRKLGDANSFSPLHKVITADGTVAWVCPRHYRDHYLQPPNAPSYQRGAPPPHSSAPEASKEVVLRRRTASASGSDPIEKPLSSAADSKKTSAFPSLSRYSPSGLDDLIARMFVDEWESERFARYIRVCEPIIVARPIAEHFSNSGYSDLQRAKQEFLRRAAIHDELLVRIRFCTHKGIPLTGEA